MNNLSDNCVFQDAPTLLEIAAALSMSNKEEGQFLGSSSPAARSTQSDVEVLLCVGEEQKLAEAVGRLIVVKPAPRLSDAARKRYKNLIAQRVPHDQAREQAQNLKSTTQTKQPCYEEIMPTDTAKKV